MYDRPKEFDWKKFRKIVPELRERYLEEKNKELTAILTDTEKTPTEQFWDTLDEMKKESKILRDCLDGHSRTKMLFYMMLMCGHRLIKREDIAIFSEELQGKLLSYIKD